MEYYNKIKEIIKKCVEAGKEVEIKVTKDGNIHIKQFYDKVFIEVFPEDEEQVNDMYNRILEEKREKEASRVFEHKTEEEIRTEGITNMLEDKKRKSIVNREERGQEEVYTAKKEVRNKVYPPKNTWQITQTKLAAILIAMGVVLGGTVATVGYQIKEGYEQTQKENEEKYKDALARLKEEIAKSANTTAGKVKILNKSSYISSSTFLTHYIININGEEYVFFEKVNCEDGHIMERRDEIMNPELIEAIGIITNAQGGNTKQCDKAAEVAEKIESGEMNVGMKAAVAKRAQEKTKKIVDDDFLR